jgi:cell filamentation protein
MPNSYKYIDSNYTYVDAKFGVLKNLVGINDQDDLMFFESVAVAKRLKELNFEPITIVGIKSLFLIHNYLFQDVYKWAGHERTVEINKDGKQFFPKSNFKNAFQFIDSLIVDFKSIDKRDKNQIAEKLA